MSNVECFTLFNGIKIPSIGYGTWRVSFNLFNYRHFADLEFRDQFYFSCRVVFEYFNDVERSMIDLLVYCNLFSPPSHTSYFSYNHY